MERKTRLFSESDLKRIEAAIATAESRTSGEIVVLVTRVSGDYRWIRWLWAAIGWAAASLVMLVLELRSDWSFPATHVLEWQAAGSVLASFLPFFDGVWRLTLPKRVAALHVHREVLANFTAAGVHETRHHSGILIYISELERRVEILGDTGIHAETGNEYWQEQIRQIVDGIRAGKGCDAVCAAVLSLGTELAKNFPPHPDDSNELPNTVLLGPQDLAKS